MLSNGFSNRNTIGTIIFQSKWLLGHYLGIILLNGSVDRIISFLATQSNISVFIRIAFDSLCHCLTAGLVWSSIEQKHFNNHALNFLTPLNCSMWKNVFLIQNKQYSWHVALALFIGGVIDVDHILAAKTWTLEGARHLSSRPFGHSVAFIVITVITMRYICKCSSRITALVGIAILTHQLRDAQRRGLWFWPLGSTWPIPATLVYGLYIIISLFGRTVLYPESSEVQDEDDDEDQISLTMTRPFRRSEIALV